MCVIVLWHPTEKAGKEKVKVRKHKKAFITLYIQQRTEEEWN